MRTFHLTYHRQAGHFENGECEKRGNTKQQKKFLKIVDQVLIAPQMFETM